MEPVWTFSRGLERLILERSEAPHGATLTVTSAGRSRSYFFATVAALVKFQTDMEHFLVNTGWRFLAFSPDRRTGIDRRSFPRVDSDRRRWWTDGTRRPVAKNRSQPS